MWKSLISTGQQANRAAFKSYPADRISASLLPATARPFTAAPYRRKEATQHNDVNDRESLNPERSEVTKSGTDNEVAQHPTAYDPHNTAPESELEATRKEQQSAGKEGNPLNVSPANQDVSAWRGPQEGGAARNADREASSARGIPKKNRSIHVKEDGTHVSYR
ncbi:uncharacterized protein N7459_001188 [Penicillium hispanicum]|uniref:uncharacterized protein n=1 Tax=Penicillium hispanicum TaxID=1080232 RepID=UPI0025422684|nr:uncharacterized protein N7459_001188 [Penicillium hispanicum]KAJ5594980.1 hypothetical protein N7459_001188 [Penicillium hispanicum]